LNHLFRRHLTNQQKRDAIEELLKVEPQLTDRAIAKRGGASHPLVARIEASGRPARERH
jgi:hypothetical protein